MRIENLTRLVDGELQNSPKISMVSGFCIDANLAKNGFAFIAFDGDKNEVEKAIANGAYAVIFDTKLKVLESEIAYIKVDSLNLCLLRLIRFFATSKEINFICVKAVEFCILKHLTIPKKVKLIGSNLQNIFLEILEAEQNSIFFCPHLQVLEKLTPSFSYLEDEKAVLINKSSIFFTNALLAKNYYQNIIFPYIFADELSKIARFFISKNIDFKFKNINDFPHFKPLFIDRFFCMKPFGSTERAFIVENDDELFIKEANFLKSKFSDVLICVPSTQNLSFDADFIFNDIKELKNLKDFRYALVKAEFEELSAMLNEKINEESLFE